MNKLTKILCSILLILGVSNSLLAKENSTILLSGKDNSMTIDFLNVNDITGLQFDVSMKGYNQKNVSIKSCVSGIAKSHVGVCKFTKNGNLRVIIFSPSNAVLNSGNIGYLNITGAQSMSNTKNQKVSIEQVVMVRPDLKEVKGDTVIDFGNDIIKNVDLIK